MTNLRFNVEQFFRTIAVFLLLTIPWTISCFATDDFTEKDKGFVSGLGFLLLFSVSIYSGQRIKRLTYLLYLSFISIATFLVASFVLGPLIALGTDSVILYTIVNSLFVSMAMTVFLNKIVGIEFKVLTGTVTVLFLLAAYFIYDKLENDLYLTYNFRPHLTMFNVFQFALIVPLTIGMSIKKGSPQHSI